MTSVFNFVPIFFEFLFGGVVAELVKPYVFNIVWQILLFNPPVRVIVGVFVELAWVVVVFSVAVLVL